MIKRENLGENLKMDRFAVVILLLIALLPEMAFCSEVDMYQLGADAANHAMDELGFEKGDVNVLTLTNAGYPVINGQTTNLCLDAIMDISGCTRAGRTWSMYKVRPGNRYGLAFLIRAPARLST